MNLKISIIVFLLLSSSISFTQYSNNERIIDSIIIEITKNYGEIYSDKIIQANSKKCYQEYKKSNYSIISFYSNLLKKHNLEPLQNTFFDSLVKLKEKDSQFSVQTFISNLKMFSDSFALNYPKEKIFAINNLEKKFNSIKEINKNKDLPIGEDIEKDNYFSFENVIILFLFLVIFVLLLGYKKLKSKTKNLHREIKNIEKSKNSFSSIKNQEDRSQDFKRKINQLEHDLEDCKKRIDLEGNTNLVLENIASHQNTENNEVIINRINNSFFFRQPTNDGNFNNELKIENFEPSISMFKLTLLSEQKANFEYCGDKMMSKLISNNPNTHLGLVCDFINTSDSFNSIIENQFKGEVELRNNIWVVTKKAVIKFS